MKPTFSKIINPCMENHGSADDRVGTEQGNLGIFQLCGAPSRPVNRDITEIPNMSDLFNQIFNKYVREGNRDNRD